MQLKCITICVALAFTPSAFAAETNKTTLPEVVVTAPAMEQLASYNSPHLSKMAKVVMDICKDCEKECRKFEKEEEICKETAESCVICFNECKKIAA